MLAKYIYAWIGFIYGDEKIHVGENKTVGMTEFLGLVMHNNLCLNKFFIKPTDLHDEAFS
jgi:hypothetical protein